MKNIRFISFLFTFLFVFSQAFDLGAAKRPRVEGVEEQSLVTSELHLTQLTKLEFGDDGFPSVNFVKTLLPGSLPRCRAIEVIKMGKLGASSEMIYSVARKMRCSLNSIYFIKIIGGTAAELRAEVRRIQSVNQFIDTLSGDGMPKFARTVGLFGYVDQSVGRHLIQVTEAAQGCSVEDILNKKLSPTEICNIGEAVGRALALFHQKALDVQQLLSVIHGDFHVGNVFVDCSCMPYQVFFIDCESCAKSIKKLQPIRWDWLEMIFTSILYYNKDLQCLPYLCSKEAPQKKWDLILLFMSSFLRGYIESYPEDFKDSLKLYIKEQVGNRFMRALELARQPINIEEDDIEPMAKECYCATNGSAKRHLFSDIEEAIWEGFIDFLMQDKRSKVLSQLCARLEQAQAVFASL